LKFGAGFVPRLVTILLIVLIVSSVFVGRAIRLPSVQASKDMLEPGDIIFVDLYEGWCATCYWDHLAIYVGDQGSDLGYGGSAVVEATFNGGIRLTPLGSFLRRDEPAEMDVRRLGPVSSRAEVIQGAISYALAQVGKPFDFTAHVTTVPHKIDDSNLHCTELIWKAYKAGGVDLDRNDGPLVYAEDMYYSPKLEPVEVS
jgi:uncharacterized protein YycO